MGKFQNYKFMFTLACALGSSSIYACSSGNSVLNTSTKAFVRKASETETWSSDMTLSDIKGYKKQNVLTSESKNTNLYQDAIDIFGEFRNLTEEEEKAYAKGLKKISRPTGRKLKI